MASPLARLSYADIQAELQRRERRVGALRRRHARLAAKLRALEAQIQRMGGGVTPQAPRESRGGRARNTMTLSDALVKVLTGKTLSVTEAVDAVRGIGYKTRSNNFRTQVNIALIKSGKFRRVGRGRYTAKS